MSIKKKIILSFFGIAFLIGLLGGLTFYHDIERAEVIAEHEAESLAETVSLFISTHIQRPDALYPDGTGKALQELIGEFKKTQDRDIVVIDMNKRIVADAVPSEIGSLFVHDRNGEVEQTLKDGKPRTFTERSAAYPAGIRQVAVVLEHKGGRIGALVMEYTSLYRDTREKTITSAKHFLLLFLAVLIIALFIGYVISGRISGPLREMRNAAARIAAGDLDTRVAYQAPDELGALADNFNKMAEELKGGMDMLHASGKVLEGEIIERRQTEHALRQANILLNTLINAIPDMVYFKDPRGRHLVVNRAFERFAGREGQDIVGKTNEELLPPDLAATCIRSDEEVMRGHEETHTEEVIAKDGGSLYFDTVKVPIYDEKGDCTGLVGVSRDVTERKKSEEALRAGEEKLRTLFDSANDAIFMLDLEGNFLDVNKTGHERLGYTKAEMLSMHISQLDPPEYAARVPERLARIRELGNAVFESAHKKKDGSVMPVEINTRILELGEKEVLFSVIRDITERKQDEDRIKAALREKEILLKEVHHRVKNNLQVIASMLQLQAGYITDRTAREILEESEKRVETMSLIHEKLYRSKDLARIDFSEYAGDLVANLFALHAGRPDNAEVKLEMEKVELDVNSAIPCGLIVNELVSNCFKHAFPDGRKGRIVVGMRRGEGGSIALAVRDNGIGFPDHLNFRNTKSLGLQLVIALVNQLEGCIEMERGEGTGFEICFTP